MKIELTDLEQYQADFHGEWEFVVSGETSESPYHAWRCAFYVQKSPTKNLIGLRLVDYGDPSEIDEEEEPEAYSELVAVCIDPDLDDEDEVVRTLLREYEASGGKYIEEIDKVGRFEIDQSGSDAIINNLRMMGFPVTLENWMALAHRGMEYEELSPEDQADVPEFLRPSDSPKPKTPPTST